MKYFSIYFKKNQGGGTQVLNKISETLDFSKIGIQDSLIKSIVNCK